MSLKNRHTTIGLLAVIIILIIVDSFVVVRFFTDDKLKEVTISQASLLNYENTISTQIAKLEEPEKYVFPEEVVVEETSEDVYQNTNEISEPKISPSSRSSVERQKIEEPAQATTTTVTTTKQVSKQKSNSSSSKIPAGQTSIGTISIPKTNVNLPILKTVTVDGMEVATCFLYSTGSLNKSGTTIIVGHNYCNGKLFSNNKKLKVGDKIYITTSKGNKREYTIYDKFITTDDDLSYLERNINNKPQIALSTCTDNEENRLVILAK